MKYYLFTFKSTFEAMKCEKILEKTMSVLTVPTLREITVSCGISLKISETNYKKALKIIQENEINASIYEIYGIGKNKTITLLYDYS